MTPETLVPICMEKTTSDAIIAAVGDGLSVHDQDFRIMYQNQAMKDLFGDCVGKRCYEAYRNEAGVCPGCPVAACFANGEIHTVERIISIGGKTYVFENSASPILDKTGAIVAVVEVVRNATGRKEAEAMVVRFSNLFEALSYTNRAIMHLGSRGELFREICRVAVTYGKFSLAVISLIDPETRLIRPVASCGKAQSYLDSLIVSDDVDREEGRGPTGIAVREGVPYICNDFADDPATLPWRAAAMENGIRSSAAFPLLHEGEPAGALKVYAEQKGFFDREIIDLLQEMAVNISFALNNFSHEERRRDAEEALRKSEERLKLVLEGSNDGFWDWDVTTGAVSLSERFIQMLGYLTGEVEETFAGVRELIHPEDRPRLTNILNNTGSGSYELELRMAPKAREWEWILFRGKVVARDGSGAPLRVAGTASNINEKKRFEEDLRYASSHDPLTGLFNRTYFEIEMERMAVSRQYPVSIVIADVDGLKLVNDSFGHMEGDRLIRQAAQALRETYRAEDLVARIGGDEFAVILPDTDAGSVKESVKRILKCQDTINEGNSDFFLSISIGAATAEHPEQLRETMKLADSRMYYYKFRRKLQQRDAGQAAE